MGILGLMIKFNSVENYKIRIIYRGEGFFYYELANDRALICDIQIRTITVFKKSIKNWDNTKRVSDS